MNKRELKDRINEIAKEYNTNLSVTEDAKNIYIKIKITIIAYTNKILPCFINADTAGMYYLDEEARQKILEALYEYSKTPFKEREELKRYIIPLPHLVTTDGEQQYLTHNGSFFASRRDKELRQTWKEEHLKYIPEEYRKYAVEVEE